MRGGTRTGGIRKGAGYAILLGVLALACSGADWAIHRPCFDIRGITVAGETDFIDAEALERSMRETLRGNYFTADLDALRRQAEAVPWVASAKVERVWPDAIRVELVRRRAVAVWNKVRLLSDRGEIFAPKDLSAHEAAGLPQFSGPDAMAPEVAEMQSVLEPLAKRLGASVTELRVTERGSWSAQIEGPELPRTKIVLGRVTADSGIAERFALVAAHYGEVSRMMGGAPAVIDARYENAFAATMPDPSRTREALQKAEEAAAQKGVRAEPAV